MTSEAIPQYSETEILAAIAGIKAGYALPQLPSPSRTWNNEYMAFANEFARIMRQRYGDYRIAGSSDEEANTKQTAVIAVHTARTARDIDALEAYHHLLLETESPGDIQRCVKALRRHHPRARITNVITAKHVAACKDVREAVLDWEAQWKPIRLVDRVLEEMVMLAMEHVDRAGEIAALIRQDITHSDRISTILEDFDSRNALLEGAL